ncbi:MAG: DegT/DnrJ/EryC1/StrS family aminotransferase [Deltaproteobacteria bacterium]|nr:DegT/DnrJ/EryC1/StrS family aminotransferase [Deltaproteobacteria bacterium]
MSSANVEKQIAVADPKAQYLSYREEIDSAIARVLNSGWYILGKEVEEFERRFAGFVGAESCFGVANGTDAIALALRACGVFPGDEVITVSHSAVATVAAIEQIGAIPVFADIEEETMGLDPRTLPALFNCRTKAVVAVHIYGQPARIEEIATLCEESQIKLVEDCAQAHGARIGSAMVGSFGDAAAFSFYPTKNLGAIGDGGAVVTSNSEIAEQLRLLRQYGWRERYISSVAGINSRLDELQAAVLNVKLPHLEADNERRRAVAERYNRCLAPAVKGPKLSPEHRHAMHLYVLRTPRRDELKRFLQERGIQSALHYPSPIHKQPAYEGRIKGGDNLPVTEKIYSEILSLPMYPELTAGDVQRVCDALISWCSLND